ncbi:MAG: hypothetical protein P8Y66_02155 [Nitrospirota bacterium]|jgi:hypothetical protein
MDLKLTDVEASAVTKALEKYLRDLEKGAPEDKGVQTEIKAVKGLIERLHSLPGAPGI